MKKQSLTRVTTEELNARATHAYAILTDLQERHMLGSVSVKTVQDQWWQYKALMTEILRRQAS